MRAILEPIFAGISPRALEIAPAESELQRDGFELLFETVQRIDQNLRYLLAGEPATPGAQSPDAAGCILRLDRDLAGIHRDFERFEASRSKQFLGWRRGRPSQQ
jgi:hypothetical protein